MDRQGQELGAVSGPVQQGKTAANEFAGRRLWRFFRGQSNDRLYAGVEQSAEVAPVAGMSQP
jgi:hypothetical protein